MRIPEIREKCKQALSRIPRDVLVFGVVVTASVLSFGCGFLAGREGGEGSQSILIGASSPAAAAEAGIAGGVVASKNGTKYYLPTCGGASRIREENKVWFATPEAARAQGYTPAANCKGLE